METPDGFQGVRHSEVVYPITHPEPTVPQSCHDCLLIHREDLYGLRRPLWFIIHVYHYKFITNYKKYKSKSLVIALPVTVYFFPLV